MRLPANIDKLIDSKIYDQFGAGAAGSSTRNTEDKLQNRICLANAFEEVQPSMATLTRISKT